MEEVDKVVRWLCALLFVLALMSLFASCGGVRYVPVERATHDSIYISRVERDSIHVHNSVYLEIISKADTIYQTKYIQKVVYRDALRIDTLYVIQVDSVEVPVPVERELSRWERTKMKIGGLFVEVIGIVCLTVVVAWYVRRRGKQKGGV